MNYEELDEAEKERRKKEAVEYRTVKSRSNLFLFCATVFGIVETVIIIFALFLAQAFVYFRVLKLTENGNMTVFSIILLVLFFVGIVTGHLLYVKVVRWVIKKWNLKDKLSKDLIDHYKTKKELLAEKNGEFVQ